jgi:hypothetical protein
MLVKILPSFSGSTRLLLLLTFTYLGSWIERIGSKIGEETYKFVNVDFSPNRKNSLNNYIIKICISLGTAIRIAGNHYHHYHYYHQLMKNNLQGLFQRLPEVEE